MNDDRPAGAEEPSPSAPPVEFYIPATSSLQVRRPRTLKHGDTFGVFDHYGDIVPAEGRHRGHLPPGHALPLRPAAPDQRPPAAAAQLDRPGQQRAPDRRPDQSRFFDAAGRLRLPKDTIHIVRAKFIWQARVYERLAVQLRPSQPRDRLTWQFQTDFADLFEVRGHQRAARGRRRRRSMRRMRSRSPTRGSRVTSAARSCNSRPRRPGSRWARRYSSCRSSRMRARVAVFRR